MGIPHLARIATSLRVRWLWRLRTDPMRPWRGLDMQFSKAELDIFAASTSMVVGDGESALFWEDRWVDGRSIKEMAPEVYALVPKRRRKVRTVREALLDRAWIPDIAGAPNALAMWQYVQLWAGFGNSSFQYTSHSCYEALFQGAITSASWELNWKSWAPPRVKFFIWLACLDRCWTGERLARRGLPHAPRCPLCDQAEETMTHLLTGCSFSKTIWFEVLSWIRSTSGPPSEGDFAVVVAGCAYYPSPAAQRYLVDHHAHGVVDLEASERCDLRQCTALGAILIRRHQD
ncbi:hypothetical protein QYE76_030234 [Lolium multiflorum]|uniref:Reverse transcriptase zinc-binding domain-containing protein n=1 Tax=Lolium multiflorum TaxID=4521 RepID=A0AAD8VIM1_LOLMU|nr:hypothetical protein QYE76_030234 [Lolium multiflorum]